MIGSPASRGAVASVGGAGRSCLAAASAVSAASAAIAASVTMAGLPQRRISTADCAIMNRFTMHAPVEMPVRAGVDQDRRPAYLTRPDTARPTRCRLLAQRRHAGVTFACPLLEDERTWFGRSNVWQ